MVLERSRAALEESGRAGRAHAEALAEQLARLQDLLRAREADLHGAQKQAQHLAGQIVKEREQMLQELGALREERERDRERAAGAERRLVAEVDHARTESKRHERVAASMAANLGAHANDRRSGHLAALFSTASAKPRVLNAWIRQLQRP